MTFRASQSTLFQVLISAIISIGLVYAVNTVAVTVAPTFLEEQTFLDDAFNKLADPSIEAVSLGGSIADEMHFTNTNLRGVKFAFFNRDLPENEAILDAILQKRPDIRWVFLAVTPMSVALDNTWRNPSSRMVFYRAAAPYRGWHPLNGDWKNLLISRFFPLVRQDNWNDAAKAIFYSLTGKSRPPPSPLGKVPMSQISDSDRALLMRQALTPFTSALENHAPYEGDGEDDLGQIILRICAKVAAHNAQLVLYTPPSLVGHYPSAEQSIAKYTAPLQRAITACQAQGALYRAWPDDNAFRQDMSNFRDSLHLSSIGGDRFMTKLLSSLPLP